MRDFIKARWWMICHPFKTAALRRFVREHPELLDEE